MRKCVFLASLVFAFAPFSALASSAWKVEESSTIKFIAKQGGAPVEGVFEAFKATIIFSAEQLEKSEIEVVIDVASVNSQSRQRDDAIRAPGLFDAKRWPMATFRSKSFKRVRDDGFEVVADLTMRDQMREVTLPFTLEILPHPEKEGHIQAHAVGELAVNRLDYGIGQGLWKDTSIIPNEVIILIDLKAVRKLE